MAYHDAIITTKDGRALEVASVGDPQGDTVVFHHGTPGSAPLVKVFDEVATRNGFFVITMSRAGYGRSDRLASRFHSPITLIRTRLARRPSNSP